MYHQTDLQMDNKITQNILGLNGLQAAIAAMESNRVDNSNLYSGIAAIRGIAATFEKQQKSYFNEIAKTNDVITTITAPMSVFNSAAILAANAWTTQLAKVQSPLLALTASLTKISQTNKLWADKIADIATSQLYLTSSLQAALNIHSQQKAAFDSLNMAITGVSGAFLKQIATTKTWEDISFVEETNTIIADAINVRCEEEYISHVNEDIENFKESIISGLSKLLCKTKTQRAKEYILELMTLISFLFWFYSLQTAPSKEDIKLIIKQELVANKDVLVDEIEAAVSKYFSKMRTARVRTNLHYSDKKNAKITGVVQPGQQVTVIEIRHKYLLISFIDKDTGEPKSGFVLKKYFIPMQ